MSQTPACPDVPDDVERRARQYAIQSFKDPLSPIDTHIAQAILADRASRALPSTALAARPEQGKVDAARDVLAERERQKTVEGWTPEHDDQHANAELARAAACYAMTASYGRFTPPELWPWGAEWWKPAQNQRGDLIKAGALILAEIERLDRIAPSTPPTAGDGHD